MVIRLILFSYASTGDAFIEDCRRAGGNVKMPQHICASKGSLAACGKLLVRWLQKPWLALLSDTLAATVVALASAKPLNKQHCVDSTHESRPAESLELSQRAPGADATARGAGQASNTPAGQHKLHPTAAATTACIALTSAVPSCQSHNHSKTVSHHLVCLPTLPPSRATAPTGHSHTTICTRCECGHTLEWSHTTTL